MLHIVGCNDLSPSDTLSLFRGLPEVVHLFLRDIKDGLDELLHELAWGRSSGADGRETMVSPKLISMELDNCVYRDAAVLSRFVRDRAAATVSYRTKSILLFTVKGTCKMNEKAFDEISAVVGKGARWYPSDAGGGVVEAAAGDGQTIGAIGDGH